MLSQGPDTVHWVQIVKPGSIHCTDSPKSIQKYFGQSPGVWTGSTQSKLDLDTFQKQYRSRPSKKVETRETQSKLGSDSHGWAKSVHRHSRQGLDSLQMIYLGSSDSQENLEQFI